MSGPATPHWPVCPGDVLTVRPGDKPVMDWAKDPDNLGLIVRSVERYHAKIPGRIQCGLMPEIMADPNGVGGTLTVVSHDGADWLVAWEGEPTMEREDPDSGRLSSCGRVALMRMGGDQLHALVDLLAGVITPADTAVMR